MTEQEYDSAMDNLEKAYEISISKIMKRYANEQIRFKIGDIITDNNTNTIIIIDTINIYKGLEKLPMPRYVGRLLRKDLEVMKSKGIGAIYGNDKVTLLKAAPVKKEVIPVIKRTRKINWKECDATESDIY